MGGDVGSRRRRNRFQLRLAMLLAALLFFHHSFSLCWSLNAEGMALLRFREGVERDPFGALSNWNLRLYDDDEVDPTPCAWFGVECSDGKVVILNLRDLCLGGTLTPQLGKLIYLKSIILRNNSFSGNIPNELGELKELEVLDLGYNNFSGPFVTDLSNNLSLSILLLDNNEFLDCISPEVDELMLLSEFQVDKNQLISAAVGASCHSGSSSWKTALLGDGAKRRLQQLPAAPRVPRHRRRSSHSPSPSPSLLLSPLSPRGSPLSSISIPPSSVPSPSESPASSPSEYLSPSPSSSPPQISVSPAPVNPPMASKIPYIDPATETSPASTPTLSGERSSKTNNNNRIMIISGVVAGSIFLFIAAFSLVFYQRNKEVTIKPWATGLSGQLQKAFVTGVPKLQRSELETACEDFSNIIGTLSDGTVYKGTLSSGVEIAVTSIAVKSEEDWSKSLETQFRQKIDTLSKLSHKNFVNLIGFCEEESPFTRMMVFEYAPNGTLFEHLHIKEAEHLDWGMRLRIAMGMAYCLEYLHQLNPPIAHSNLRSSSIYLTEDYAAKISDFSFWNETNAARMGTASMELLETTSSDPESNVYSFGVILFEMITGRFPYSVDIGPPADWASDYLKWDQPLKEMVDPTLSSFKEHEVEKLFDVVRDCVHCELSQRPTMREVTARLKEITAMEPDGATPRVSPLWWAELEIMSTESK